MEKKKKFLILGVVFLCILMITGVSFALWQVTLQQTTENVVTTGCFKIEFRDVNPINLEKAYPISDEEGRSLVPYEFTITNTCNSFASYQINLEILNTTTLENLDYLKVMLDDKTNILTENESVIKTLENAKTSYKLKTGYLRENGSKTFYLRLWLNENTPTREAFMNKLFESKVTIIATYKENLDNNINVNAISQSENFSGSETFQIHATSESFNLVSMSDDLETWEELETKGKDITVEKTVTTNGTYTFYFQDEAENVQEVTVTATKIDDKKPIANMSVTKSNNVISINASGSKDNETSIAKYYYSKDGTNYVESTSNTYEFPLYDYGVATTMLENYKNQKVYVKVEDEIGNTSDVKEYSLTTNELLYDGTLDNNLRYVGASPNNYIDIGDRDADGYVIPWRIIGVMNNIYDGVGAKETRLKVIRNEGLGLYSWDGSTSNINNADGINEWSQADAMKLLNPGYESETIGGSLYWNKQNGNCYSDRNNATSACDFTSTGISGVAKQIIGNTLWQIGSNDGVIYTYNNISASKFYELERSGNIGKICSNGMFCNDNVARTTTWVGKIGLMYPSDYGYATSGGDSTSRSNCLAVNLYNWNSYSNCYLNDWIYMANDWQWTTMPLAYSSAANNVFFVSTTGQTDTHNATNPGLVRPVSYLKSNVKIISGTGELNSPYHVNLN